MELGLRSIINSWFAEHTSVLWFFQHPIVSIVGILLALILFARLLVAIATLIDRLWLWILHLPLALFKSVFRLNNQKEEVITGTTINYELSTNSEDLAGILKKLELIEQQQQQIIEDLALLKNPSSSIKRLMGMRDSFKTGRSGD